METCPNCGADVPPRAKACAACGACEKTGWSDKARYDDLGIPTDEFNYDEFVQNEFGGGPPARRKAAGFWWLVAVVLLLAMLFWLTQTMRVR
ncbi:MAG: zinc-ribbon domain-containing protein [Verrucomicrobia bacterium]|nr:zinc-ribbon domain-containing protein [Verrucomicrobiota bacterium]